MPLLLRRNYPATPSSFRAWLRSDYYCEAQTWKHLSKAEYSDGEYSCRTKLLVLLVLRSRIK